MIAFLFCASLPVQAHSYSPYLTKNGFCGAHRPARALFWDKQRLLSTSSQNRISSEALLVNKNICDKVFLALSKDLSTSGKGTSDKLFSLQSASTSLPRLGLLLEEQKRARTLGSQRWGKTGAPGGAWGQILSLSWWGRIECPSAVYGMRSTPSSRRAWRPHLSGRHYCLPDKCTHIHLHNSVRSRLWWPRQLWWLPSSNISSRNCRHFLK